MPVAVSYPGVYIQEIPSGVRTITGVATSVAAFVGYTAQGYNNKAVQVFSFADYERSFGNLHEDSLVSYAVQHFFLNGGSQAWIVRVAKDAVAAQVSLGNSVAAGSTVLVVTARSEGTWGNGLRVEVDYDTANPASLFNLTVTEVVNRGGVLQPARSETHRNLSMNSHSGSYAVDVINLASELIKVERPAAAAVSGKGTSTSGLLTAGDLNRLNNDHHFLAISIDEDEPHEFDLFDNAGGTLTNTSATLSDRLDNLAESIRLGVIHSVPSFSSFTCARRESTIVATSPTLGERSSVRFLRASQRSATDILKLGTTHGGREEDAVHAIRPAQTGTVGQSIAALNLAELAETAAVNVTIQAGDSSPETAIKIDLWGGRDRPTRPDTLQALVTALQEALARSQRVELRQARLALIDGRLRIVAGGSNPNVLLTFADASREDTTATVLGLAASDTASPAVNVARYALGVGVAEAAQQEPSPGSDGIPPEARQLRGSRSAKTGLFALEEVDLFNLLCIPDLHRLNADGFSAVVPVAEAYVEERRAFFIVDLPAADVPAEDKPDSFVKVQQWMQDNLGMRHKNAAVYFPRITASDPLKGNRPRSFPNSGAIAGLFARIDAARGVWKAPAGTEAVLRGVRKLDYPLTDQENGVLNQRGINCLRNLPVVGPASWGARSLVGDDNLASEWKYIPVRRLTLFLEESLYRGTQWVVFEPNDEPLWAQIRLNVGAFMQNLFRQGAFQGQTPREAYLVKCDAETTTQNDINLGIVNIVVGFAPLKPAEFVIISIQQLAGQVQV